LCPLCGGPIDECTAPETKGERYRAKKDRCQRTDAIVIAQNAARESNVRNPEALLWWTQPIPGR
jgi:hypothetical protein